MSSKIKYSMTDFVDGCTLLAHQIKQSNKKYKSIYGVPRGGIAICLQLSKLLNIPILTLPHPKGSYNWQSTLVVDDLVATGTTRKKYSDSDFAVIHVKCIAHSLLPTYYVQNNIKEWIIYPWEETEQKSIEDNIIRTIEFIGEDPNREGLKETPKRIVNSWKELYSGYDRDEKEVFKTFPCVAYDEMVLLRDIELYSMCEHHLLPFVGKCHIAYIPDKQVIGISKLARLLEVYSRRLQIQEQLTHQITESLMKNLKPHGAACVIEAEHFCMRMRGVSKQNSTMVTSSLKGAFKDNVETRSEFMRLIGK